MKLFILKLLLSLLAFAETLAQRDVADSEVRVVPHKNEIWLLETNRYGEGVPSIQFVFWESPTRIRKFYVSTYVKGWPDGSPWTFKYDGRWYTVHYEKYRETNSLTDPEFNDYREFVEKRDFTPDDRPFNPDPPHTSWPWVGVPPLR